MTHRTNGVGAPFDEEHVQRRVEETDTAGDPQGGIRPGAGATPDVVHRETAQNTTQGEEKAAAPLETGARRRVDAEKQRAAKAKAA